ncbi:TRAP transporter substrate-binding protein [Marinimicrococcus flavescens]|uniref:TRAP transporter substrate-binding protein n=1 Tax=Marinimicrococcus flavescens TaxID=3031815 RepID=A0AAP3XQF3_9PROT|nr:TRAP transporter substrate-binding protein [Marinimicrococcus flavescens]
MTSFKAALLGAAGALALASGAAAAEFDIRASHGESIESPLHKGWQVFEAYVEGNSGGRIEVTVLPSSQLGTIGEALEQAKIGAIQMAHGDEQNLDRFYGPMVILATPYLFANDEEAQVFLRSDTFAKMNDAMAEQSNLRLLAAASYGFRTFTNNVRPIKSPADMEGIRMRVPPSPMSLEMVKAMGGSPTPVPWEELYGAMQQGVVDGQENPLGVIHDYSFWQVQKYLTVDNHQLGLNSLVINETFYKSLPEELREVVLTGAQMAAATEYGERNYQARVSAVDALREKGMEVYFPTPEEAQQFRDATREPLQAYLKEELGDEIVEAVYAEIDRIREAARNAVQ